MSLSISLKLLDEEEKEVEFYCDYEIANTGIGSYELWGSRQFDSGYDHAKVKEVKWDKSLFSGFENQIIANWVAKNKIRIEDDVYIIHTQTL
jgi:hypothetical protein